MTDLPPKTDQNVEENQPQEEAKESPALSPHDEALAQVEKLEGELLAIKDKLLRLAAEFDNYKKANEREKQQAIKFANENILLSLLPIMDSLEQALAALKKPDEASGVITGVEMVVKIMQDTLAKYGLNSFSALNEMFDPSRHEAMGEKEDKDVAAGTVITEYQKGYSLHGRLIRPARVIIAARAPKED